MLKSTMIIWGSLPIFSKGSNMDIDIERYLIRSFGKYM